MRKISKEKFIYPAMLAYTVLSFAGQAYATEAFNNPLGISSFGSLINTLLNFIMGFIGIIAVIFLVYSGFKYVTAGGDSKKAGEAKEGITHAIIGIAVALIGFLLVGQIFKIFKFQGTWNQLNS